MKERIIAALCMLPFAVAVLMANEFVVMIAGVVLSLWASYEISASYGFNSRGKILALVYIMGSTFFVALKCVHSFSDYINEGYFNTFFTSYIMLGFVVMLIKHQNVKARSLWSAALVSMALTFFLMHAVNLRIESELGNYLIWLIPVSACFTDTFALFAGKFFGKRKLAPSVSPKKTVEGAIGGILGSVFMNLLYGLIVRCINPEIEVNFLYLAILGFLCSLASQIGDLSMSLIKREAGIKDYGNFIPGHGGMLDRFDSIIFASPVVYIFVTYIEVLTK